jgi:hypothetical protein
MDALSTAALLRAWEGGLGRSPVERALVLLGTAGPDPPADDPATLPIGERDARLLVLRERAFGPQLTGLTDCPGCGERLEFDFAAADVQAVRGRRPAAGRDGRPDVGGDAVEEGVEGLRVAVGDFQVRFRLPNSVDLAAIPPDADVERARDLLLTRCVLEVRREGREGLVEHLPADVQDAVVARMAEADPQGDVQIALTCPACGNTWEAAFDILTTVWAEVDAWARRLLRDVHALASAYGWRETDVLALSPVRRQAYLEMVMEERWATT